MKGDTKIPEDIKKYVPEPCCRIRMINGTYYVNKYQAVKLPSGKWSSSNGYAIGKIIPGEGFCPNKRYLLETAARKETSDQVQLSSDVITDVAYGQYDLLMKLSEDIYTKLQQYFAGERAAQIYCYALILCANGMTYIDQIDEYYQESFLSLRFRNYSFKMGYDALSSLLHDLGMRGNPIRCFEQSMIDNSSKNIAIDGHVIRSCSENNDLADAGYKMSLLKAPQVNLLIAYDINSKMPLLYRTFRGSSVDKCSVIELLECRSFKDTKFVVDRGFYAEKALDIMSSNGNCYIIPVQSNNKYFKKIKESLTYSTGEFIYVTESNTSARIVYQEEPISEGKRLIVFKDEDENNSKRKSYKLMMECNENGYTQENYEKYRDWWGVYCLETTCDESAPEIFKDYKNRWSIETYNNYVKNDAHFNNLKIQDYYVEHGFDFIMLVTGIIHSRLNDAVKKIGRPSISTHDILIKAGHLRMVLDENQWSLRNRRTKDIDLLLEAGFTPYYSYPTA